MKSRQGLLLDKIHKQEKRHMHKCWCMCLFYIKRVMIQGKLPIFILKNRNCRRLRLAKDKKKEGEAMRIGTYNMISQIYGNTGTKKTKTSGTTGSGSFWIRYLSQAWEKICRQQRQHWAIHQMSESPRFRI